MQVCNVPINVAFSAMRDNGWPGSVLLERATQVAIGQYHVPHH